MKKSLLKRIIGAVIVSSVTLSALAFPVSAEGLLIAARDTAAVNTAAEAEDSKKSSFVELDGMKRLVITSSTASGECDTRVFFDGLLDSSYTVLFLTGKTDTFSIYTSTKYPERLKSLAAQIAYNKDDTDVEISVYGTNNNGLTDWKKVNVEEKSPVDGYTVFEVVGKPVRYALYRFDFTVKKGDVFMLSELTLFKDEDDTAEYRYKMDEDGNVTLVYIPPKKPMMFGLLSQKPFKVK